MKDIRRRCNLMVDLSKFISNKKILVRNRKVEPEEKNYFHLVEQFLFIFIFYEDGGIVILHTFSFSRLFLSQYIHSYFQDTIPFTLMTNSTIFTPLESFSIHKHVQSHIFNYLVQISSILRGFTPQRELFYLSQKIKQGCLFS